MRPDWDTYFLTIAKDVAKRSTCPRASVGTVIVRDNRILATGYNGAPPGEPHCIDVGCIIIDNHCVRVVHAEANAIAQAAKFGIPIQGSTMYIWSNTKIPSCPKCTQLTKVVGIIKVVGADVFRP